MACAQRAGASSVAWEWTETPVSELFRGLRSGRWFLGNNKQSAGQFFSNPEFELVKIGFRVVQLTQD